jgi:copper chaperone CopZ
MHFATPRNLIAMALAWALFLIAYDQHANPRPLATYWAEFKGSSTRPTVVSEGDTPRVKLSMPHLCCTGCLNDIRAALKPLTWLAPARLATEPPAIEDIESTGVDAPSNQAVDAPTAHEIEFDILDLTKANFVDLDRALRDTGLVPDRVEVSGMGHFRLEVELPHLCCKVCSKAVDEQLERLLRKETQGRWLDSMTMNHVKKTVLIYARLNSVVDLVELTRALEHAGFSAHSIRILTGPES